MQRASLVTGCLHLIVVYGSLLFECMVADNGYLGEMRIPAFWRDSKVMLLP